MILTVNIFALLVAPTAIVVRGYDVKWNHTLLFAVLSLVLQLLILLFESAHQFELLRSTKYVVVLSIVPRVATLTALAYVLRDRRLSKLLGIQRKEARSAVAIGISVANGLLHCVGPLYQVASSPGFEMDVLLAAVHSNVTFIIALLMVEALATSRLGGVGISIVVCGTLEALHPSLNESSALWYMASVAFRLSVLWVAQNSLKVHLD